MVQGEVKAAPEGAKQVIEVHATKILHLGQCEAAQYPIAKAKLSLEFLREKIHLRVRTNTISAVQRVRCYILPCPPRVFSQHCRWSSSRKHRSLSPLD